jgi:hypothetical protein
VPFRRVLLINGDTEFVAAKTFDLGVWLPGQWITWNWFDGSHSSLPRNNLTAARE